MRLLALSLLLAACGNDIGVDPADDSPDAPVSTDGYVPLITGDWSLPAATEKYVCVRFTATTDTYISSIRPIAPIGTHHTVLMLGPPDAADGTVDCDSSLIKPAIYGSGVGTQALDMPAGVAVHVKPGQQLLLNLHLFNASDAAITGTSGVEILPVDASAVQHEAGVVLVGKAAGLQVPPGASTQTGTCTTPAGGTVFAVGPHMHLLGRHMKVTYADAGGANPRTLLDVDYSFDDQRLHPLDQMLVTTAGGKATVECSYFNPSGNTVTFGEHTEDEMCYALTYVYPPPPVTTCTK